MDCYINYSNNRCYADRVCNRLFYQISLIKTDCYKVLINQLYFFCKNFQLVFVLGNYACYFKLRLVCECDILFFEDYYGN